MFDIAKEILVGDRVIIIHSPYSEIGDGTQARVTEIRRDHYGRGRHAYILSELQYQVYRKTDIRLVHDQDQS